MTGPPPPLVCISIQGAHRQGLLLRSHASRIDQFLFSAACQLPRGLGLSCVRAHESVHPDFAPLTGILTRVLFGSRQPRASARTHSSVAACAPHTCARLCGGMLTIACCVVWPDDHSPPPMPGRRQLLQVVLLRPAVAGEPINCTHFRPLAQLIS